MCRRPAARTTSSVPCAARSKGGPRHGSRPCTVRLRGVGSRSPDGADLVVCHGPASSTWALSPTRSRVTGAPEATRAPPINPIASPPAARRCRVGWVRHVSARSPNRPRGGRGTAVTCQADRPPAEGGATVIRSAPERDATWGGAPPPPPTDAGGVSRRAFLRAGGVGGAAVGLYGAGSFLAPSLRQRGFLSPDGVFGA